MVQLVAAVEPIVYFSFPARGHIHPTLPVVRELARRGRAVAYFSTERFRPQVEAAGAAFLPYCAEIRMPERGPGPFARLTETLETLLAWTRAALRAHLQEVCELNPPLIMFDSFAPWGKLFAQLLRAPSIGSIPSILVDAGIDARYGNALSAASPEPQLTALWHREFRLRCRDALGAHGLAEIPSPSQLLQSYGDFNIVYTSRRFQPDSKAFDARRFQFVGPCLDFRPEETEFPFERLDARPLILVSLGTVYGERPEFLRACLEELADGAWQVVLSTGGRLEADALGPMPENCMARDYVPQIELLGRAAVFVTHGGMNSVQEALFHGVPMVLAPQGADQFWIAALVAELGAGLALDAANLQTGAIRASVERALKEPAYAEAARRVGRTLRAAGGSARAADAILRFERGAAGPPRYTGGR